LSEDELGELFGYTISKEEQKNIEIQEIACDLITGFYKDWNICEEATEKCLELNNFRLIDDMENDTDEMLAYYYKNKLCDYVYTTDSDMLGYGVSYINKIYDPQFNNFYLV
jgi:5'-3' exonuclease